MYFSRLNLKTPDNDPSRIILVAALVPTGDADVAANVAGPVLIEPAFQLVALTAQAAGEGTTAGVEYTAKQLEALHKFLGDEGCHELSGRGAVK